MFRFTPQEISGIGIVAGTAIGASMLSLPFVTGVSGFWLACLLLIASYLYSISTLLLWLEVTLYTKDPSANFISIAKQRLGPAGEKTVWVTYLLLLYTISMSYIAGGGDLLVVLSKTVGLPLSTPACQTLYTALFGLVAFRGVHMLDMVNQSLLVGMLLSYLGLIAIITPSMSLDYLQGGEPSFIWSGIPISVAAFACHFVVPTLRKNFSTDTSSLKKMLWIGCSVPLVVYIVYQLLIISALPFGGKQGLLAISATAAPLSGLIEALGSGGRVLPILVSTFSNCAILTSFLGVVIALSDFLQDGLSISDDNPFKTLITSVVTLGPPLLFVFMVPKESPGFIIALDFSGLLVSFLFGILLVIMAWQARYRAHLQCAYVLPGGKPVLLLLGALSIGIIMTVIASKNHLLPTAQNSVLVSS